MLQTHQASSFWLIELLLLAAAVLTCMYSSVHVQRLCCWDAAGPGAAADDDRTACRGCAACVALTCKLHAYTSAAPVGGTSVLQLVNGQSSRCWGSSYQNSTLMCCHSRFKGSMCMLIRHMSPAQSVHVHAVHMPGPPPKRVELPCRMLSVYSCVCAWRC